ncbi:MAG: trypsin-like peptidase domain-containing protein [Candidatus Aminicenantes bacterium]|jgi:hypothetical protein
MAGRRTSQYELTIEDLDRELIARGAQIPQEALFKFDDIEGTPARDAVMARIKELYDSASSLSPNPALASIDTWALVRLLIHKLREPLEEVRKKGIWYEDHRIDFNGITDERVKKNLNCVAAIMLKNNLIDEKNGFSTIKVKNYGESFNLYEGEAFRDQPIIAGRVCTGFLVKKDVIATTPFCVNESNLKDLRIVFGYNMLDPYTPVTKVPNENIYNGVKIIYKGFNRRGNKSDWALFQLDREVENQEVAKLSGDDILYNQPVYVIGHPLGLPVKYAPGGKVLDFKDSLFAVDLDVYMGSAGSPVFNYDTHEVIGIVVYDNTQDFRWTGKGWASVIYPSPNKFSIRPQCTKISEFIDYYVDAYYFEKELLKAVSEGLYSQAIEYLQKIIRIFPEREGRLKEEFGYIYNYDNSEYYQIEWRRKMWQVLSERNNFILGFLGEKDMEKLKENGRVQIIDTKVIKPSQPNYIRKGKTPAQIGAELEIPVLNLFEKFLTMCGERFDIEILKKRKQRSGFQFGYDLEFDCQIKGNKPLKLRIECKNYAKEIKLKDITEKLAMSKLNYSNDPIDHWIVIAPFAIASNDLNFYLNSLENTDEYPFKVHVWGIESKVDQLFGLAPEIYSMFFKPSKGEIHPRDWGRETKQKVQEFWRQKLPPPLRLPAGWEQYLREPGKFILHGDKSELENLYKSHVTLNCKDDTGVLIQDKTLEDKVNEWLEKPVKQHPTLVLLGEFGDGKTVFSYILSRNLAGKFLESPSYGWLPVRFSLKDFSIENVNNSRDFVRRRLEEFGADINGWDTLKKSEYKLLAILDGFDEISKKLDHKTILKNIKKIIECYQNEFSDMKLLITSRKHFFENQEHKDQLLQRIGNPELLQIAPIDRKTTEEHLLEYAKEIDKEEKFNQLKNFYDPIELASKPLFLEMVKVSLEELPNEELNELILYETYTQKSLERKFEYLEDEELETSPMNIIENMKEILENLAVKLHQSDAEFIYLSDVHGADKYLERLWKMSNPEDCAHDDEVSRIAVRSLLKRVGIESSKEGKKWPVDFCHRSIREYFVARAVCKILKHNLEQARQFLRNYYLNHEIVFFASKMMKKSGFDYTEKLWQLIRETKGQSERKKFKIGHLGSNAANLLYQFRGTLPHNDWSCLVLDGVDFSGADLSGKNFSHTSFHYANLDNVNFLNTDFSNCDLTGVRLEEASPVHAIAVTRDENIYALYDDGIIREWKYKRVRKPYPDNLEEIQKLDYVRLIAQPGNDLTVIDDRQLIFFDKENKRLKERARIDIKPSFIPIKASSDTLLLFNETDNQHMLQLVDLEKQSVINEKAVEPFALCDHLGTSAFIIYGKEQYLQIVDITSQKRKTIMQPCTENITCLDTCSCEDSPGQYRLACGQADGKIVVFQIFLSQWEVKKIFECHYHEKIVNDIAFIDEENIITGGFDKKIFKINISQEENAPRKPIEFKLHLQCKGMEINGIKPDEKRLFLEKLIAKASTEDDVYKEKKSG